MSRSILELNRCPICNDATIHTSYLEDSRYRYECSNCKQYFEFNASSQLKADTIFNNIISQNPLSDWVISDGDVGLPTAEELSEINRFTRHKVLAEDVVVFTIKLCDNDVDVDGDRFTVEALFKLQELYVGRSGTCYIESDIGTVSVNGRIFECCVDSKYNEVTKTGDDYFYLSAKVFILRNAVNSNMIHEIFCNPNKESSIGCAVHSAICSICRQNVKLHENTCNHRHAVDQYYDNQLSCLELIDPIEAYEWALTIHKDVKERQSQ